MEIQRYVQYQPQRDKNRFYFEAQFDMKDAKKFLDKRSRKKMFDKFIEILTEEVENEEKEDE